MKHINVGSVVTIVALLLGISSAAVAENKSCSNNTLKGSFAFTSTGTLLDTYAPPPFAGPFAEVGVQAFDGSGGTAATATLSSNGNIVSVTVTGTYSVNPDCTGTMTLNVSPFNSVIHLSFAIDRHGNGFQAIETEPGLIITRVARRQFSQDADHN
jgi:hypothetical protein